MPFVLPMTDQEAENARLLDRLTKQQEINQSLRAENAKLKADIKLYTNGMSLEEWHDDMEQQKAEITDDAERDIAQLEATLINYRSAMDDIEKWSADIEDINDILPELKKLNERIEKKRVECLDWQKKGCLEAIKHDTEIEKLNEQIEKLKAELLDINAKHYRDTQKTCLKAKFDTWREGQVKYNSDYNMEDEAFWLVGEATNIQDAIEVFNELYEDGTGDDYTWKLECDHERKWEIDQWWMDEEGEYTLTEGEWEAQTLKQDTNDNTCDFCDKQRQVLTKRDAGYDEWTCSTCHKEQYPEQYEEKQTSETDPAEIYMSDTARGIEHSTGSPKKKRVIVRWYENGVAVEKMLMRKRGYCHSHKTEAQHYAPAPRGGVEPTENGWKCCDKAGDMVFIENGKYVNGHYLADFKQ